MGDADVQADIDRASGENRELDDADVTGQPWRPAEGSPDRVAGGHRMPRPTGAEPAPEELHTVRR